MKTRSEKVYVKVNVDCDSKGYMTPKAITWKQTQTERRIRYEKVIYNKSKFDSQHNQNNKGVKTMKKTSIFIRLSIIGKRDYPSNDAKYACVLLSSPVSIWITESCDCAKSVITQFPTIAIVPLEW